MFASPSSLSLPRYNPPLFYLVAQFVRRATAFTLATATNTRGRTHCRETKARKATRAARVNARAVAGATSLENVPFSVGRSSGHGEALGGEKKSDSGDEAHFGGYFVKGCYWC